MHDIRLVSSAIETFKRELVGSGFHLRDFGGGQSVSPLFDPVKVSYLSSYILELVPDEAELATKGGLPTT